MEFVGVFITGIVNCFWAPLASQFNHLRSLKGKVNTLKAKIEELSAREKDVKKEMNTAVAQLRKQTKNEVQVWLERVEKVTNEVGSIEKEFAEKRRCMKGCFPDFHSHLKLSKHATEKIEAVVELQEKGRFSDGLFINPPSASRSILPVTMLVGKTTAEKILERIWDSLMDVEIGRIGVYGMGGVGKTTIMTHINNRLKGAQIFDDVIWVTVSQALSLDKLQKDIAKAVDLDFSSEEDEMTRAAILFEYLLRRKFVIILDDMWCRFSLENVGIPHPNRDNGCKLVMTTRLMEVCRGMETQREIKVEVLSEEEAWDLFKAKVGGEVALSPDIEAVARRVAEECGRLPLAIITVGRAMREVHDIRVWRNALEELRGSRPEIEGMDDDVFARLKFSYNRLKSDRIRACFLYCSLFPKDEEFDGDELVEYWMAEGLISEVGDREKEIDKGYAILNELKDACMLESAKIRARKIKMHDLIRDLAINITRESPRFIVKAGVGLKKVPNEEEWVEDAEKISLMENKIDVLLDRPRNPRLTTLMLQRNPLPKNIPQSFFEHMPNLRVLDLSDTRIESLPDSLSNLENLRALLLRFSEIEKLPSVAKLKALRVLDLSCTPIKELGPDIKELVNLRRLDLSHTEDLEVFPEGVISNLSLLEDLSMYGSGYQWSIDTMEMGGANIKEIMSAAQLNNLGLSFTDFPSFISYVRSWHWKELRSFHVGIGLLSSFPSTSRRNYSVEIQGCDLVSYRSTMVLPNNTLQLGIQGCHDITRLSELSCLSGLTELRECYISRCNGLEFIVVARENILLSLETLTLRKLPSLSAFCRGVMPQGTLVGLRTLNIHCCDNLKILFSLELLQHLQHLEEIEVWNCSKVEEIIAREEAQEVNSSVAMTVTLPRLRHLYCSTLLELKSIFNGVFICNSLQAINIWDCPKLKKLPISSHNLPPNLKVIGGSRKWWDALEWNDPSAKTLLQLLFKEGEEEEDDDEDEEDNNK